MRTKSELRGYQQRVVKYLYERDEAMAILKVGAGKTISTLTAIGELIGDGFIRHALVIAPKRVATIVWPNEILDWTHTHDLNFAVLDGPPAYRARKLTEAGLRDITVIGIDNVQWLCAELETLDRDHPVFDCLVIDETSKLKDPKSKRGKALAKLANRFKMRWGLTGTPRPNSLLDLFTPAKVITDGKLWGGSFYGWQKKHFYPTDFNGYQWAVLPDHEAVLLGDIASISITLGEGDMPELPQLSILVDEVTLPPEVRVAYRTMERQLFAAIDKDTVLAASRAIATGKLAQMANGFVYGEGGFGDGNYLHQEKLDWLEALVDSLDGEPMIVVYEFQEDLAMIRSRFPDVPTLAGATDVGGARLVKDWNAGKLPLLALHPASAGHGLNLQHGGSRMAWMAPTWSAELWEQTIGRLYRPGQQAHVMVHICCARDTVDQLKRSRVISKLSAQAAFEAYLKHRVAA
jgi:hypothetical protein